MTRSVGGVTASDVGSAPRAFAPFAPFDLTLLLARLLLAAAAFAGLAFAALFLVFVSAGFRVAGDFALPLAFGAEAFAPLRLLVFFGMSSFPFVRFVAATTRVRHRGARDEERRGIKKTLPTADPDDALRGCQAWKSVTDAAYHGSTFWVHSFRAGAVAGPLCRADGEQTRRK